MMCAVATLAITISDRTMFAMTPERRKNSVSSKRTVLTVPAEYENISQVRLGKGRRG